MLHLAELKGVAASIPHQAILINTLGIQEANDSSEIENIVTTHDELFKDYAFPEIRNPAAKEVLRSCIPTARSNSSSAISAYHL